MLLNMDLYLAIQDEIWRFNAAIHREHLKPTIYRHGKTLLVTAAFLESDVLWFTVYGLFLHPTYLHIRVPFINDEIHFCHSSTEWMFLLYESDIPRNAYFDNNNNQRRITDRLVSGPL